DLSLTVTPWNISPGVLPRDRQPFPPLSPGTRSNNVRRRQPLPPSSARRRGSRLSCTSRETGTIASSRSVHCSRCMSVQQDGHSAGGRRLRAGLPLAAKGKLSSRNALLRFGNSQEVEVASFIGLHDRGQEQLAVPACLQVDRDTRQCRHPLCHFRVAQQNGERSFLHAEPDAIPASYRGQRAADR